MHIHISDFKGSLAEKNKKMHMTTARKGRHEAKKKPQRRIFRSHESTKTKYFQVAINRDQQNSL